MNFRQGPRWAPEEPEINLIPFIDVLLVVLIFLMLTTTFSRYTELQVRLPVADADAAKQAPKELVVGVGRDGRYALDGRVLEAATVDMLAQALQAAAKGQTDTVVVISADAAASHQAVIQVMDAARRSGLAQLTFATQTASTPPR